MGCGTGEFRKYSLIFYNYSFYLFGIVMNSWHDSRVMSGISAPSPESKQQENVSQTVACFHCQEVFQSASDVHSHLLEKHVSTSKSMATSESVVNSSHDLLNNSANVTFTGVTVQDLPIDSAILILNSDQINALSQSLQSSGERKRKIDTSNTTKPKGPCACDICDFSTSSPAALTVHRKIHFAPELKSWFKCHLCDFSSKTFKDLSQHGMDTHRLDDGKYLCPQCKKTFENYSKVRRHFWMTHVDMNVICPECGKKFLRMDRLNKHTASTHSDIPAGYCSRCGKAFRRKDKLKDHEELCKPKDSSRSKPPGSKNLKKPGPKCIASSLVPTPDERYSRFPFRCDLCRVGFKNHKDLLIHAEARHKDHMSPIVYPMNDLKLLSHNAEPKKYSCPSCQVVWRSISELDVNTFSHYFHLFKIF